MGQVPSKRPIFFVQNPSQIVILVQNDAKLMPNVVQGGREYQTGGASEASALRGKYSSISRT